MYKKYLKQRIYSHIFCIFAPAMDKFEEQLKHDLHQFLQTINEVDERLPECPDVEDKWEARLISPTAYVSFRLSLQHRSDG